MLSAAIISSLLFSFTFAAENASNVTQLASSAMRHSQGYTDNNEFPQPRLLTSELGQVPVTPMNSPMLNAEQDEEMIYSLDEEVARVNDPSLGYAPVHPSQINRNLNSSRSLQNHPN